MSLSSQNKILKNNCLLIHDTHHTKVNCENVFNPLNEELLTRTNMFCKIKITGAYTMLYHVLTTGLVTLESFKNRSLISKRIEYILEGNLLEKSVKRPFCCTVSILQVLKENQIMK